MKKRSDRGSDDGSNVYQLKFPPEVLLPQTPPPKPTPSPPAASPPEVLLGPTEEPFRISAFLIGPHNVLLCPRQKRLDVAAVFPHAVEYSLMEKHVLFVCGRDMIDNLKLGATMHVLEEHQIRQLLPRRA